MNSLSLSITNLLNNISRFFEIDELNISQLTKFNELLSDILIGRKSKKSYKVGDPIEVKIIKVDILKYQIDLELT